MTRQPRLTHSLSHSPSHTLQVVNGGSTTLKFQLQNSKGWPIQRAGSHAWVARLHCDTLHLGCTAKAVMPKALQPFLTKHKWVQPRSKKNTKTLNLNAQRDLRQCFALVNRSGVATFEDIQLIAA